MLHNILKEVLFNYVHEFDDWLNIQNKKKEKRKEKNWFLVTLKIGEGHYNFVYLSATVENNLSQVLCKKKPG